MFQIDDFIPMGHENAITYDELCFDTGLTPRQIRREIEKSSAVILNLQDGKGFFQFDPYTAAEREFARKYSAQEKSRGWSCIKKAMRVDKALNKTNENVFNGNLYRLARLLKGEGIEDTAHAVGVSARALKMVENGKKTLTDAQHEAFTQFIGFDIKEGR